MYPQAGILLWAIALVTFATRIHAGTIYVDDGDPLIAYGPTGNTWALITEDAAMDWGGTHRVSTVRNAAATIRYTFYTAKFYAAKWPYAVTTTVTIDGQSWEIDLQDYDVPVTEPGHPPTRPSSLVAAWNFGTVSKERTVVVSMSPDNDFVVFDMMAFDVVDPLTATTTITLTSTPEPTTGVSAPASSTAQVTGSISLSISPSSTATASPKRANSLAIAVGVVGAVFGCLFSLLLFYFCCRKRAKRKSTYPSTLIEFPDVSRSPYHATLSRGPLAAFPNQPTMSESHLLQPMPSARSLNRSLEAGSDYLPNPHDNDNSPTIEVLRELSTRPTVPPLQLSAPPPSLERDIYPDAKNGVELTFLQYDPSSRYPESSLRARKSSLAAEVSAAASTSRTPIKSIYDDLELMKALKQSKLPEIPPTPRAPPAYHTHRFPPSDS